MSISLYDEDMHRYIHVPMNLELMKLASYYKKRNEIVVLTPSLHPDYYTRTILRKDYDDGNFIKNPTQIPGLEVGGLAYSDGRYIPMPEDIEATAADTSIYSKFEDMFCDTIEHTNAFKVMSRAEHLRLSMDGKTIWPRYSTQLKSLRTARCLFFHDVDLGNIEGARDLIMNLTKHMYKSVTSQKIGSKFPITVKSPQDLMDWSDFWNTSAFYSLKFNGVMDDECFHDFIIKTQNKTISDQLIYNISADERYATNDFLQNKLPQIYKQVIFSRSHKRKIRLYYSDGFFPDQKWERLLKFWQCFHNQCSYFDVDFMNQDSLYKFACSIEEQSNLPKDLFKAQEVRELFYFVKEQNYELFRLFYECRRVILRGGKFENDTAGN